MSLKRKRIAIIIIFAVLLLITSAISIEYIAYASNTETYAYQDGTSYSASHAINADASMWNYAEEAHGYYQFYQKSDVLPLQVYYVVYPHMEADNNLTMNCDITATVTYKVWGFLWNTTKEYSTDVTYNELSDGKSVIGHLDGPNQNGITVVTVYTFSDAAYGNCRWTITAK